MRITFHQKILLLLEKVYVNKNFPGSRVHKPLPNALGHVSILTLLHLFLIATWLLIEKFHTRYINNISPKHKKTVYMWECRIESQCPLCSVALFLRCPYWLYHFPRLKKFSAYVFTCPFRGMNRTENNTPTRPLVSARLDKWLKNMKGKWAKSVYLATVENVSCV